MDKYEELRAALEQTCHALLIDDPDTIRALLSERDALRATTQELIDAAEGCFFGSGYNPAGTLRSAVNAARAALAQGEA